LIHLGSVLILAVCFCGHVSEVFDHWDHTLQTGNDVEYTATIIALVVGTALILAHVAVTMVQPCRAQYFSLSYSKSEPTHSLLVPGITASPPTALRI